MRNLILAILMMASLPAHAALRIFACEPEWAALARELAGPDAHIDAATTAQQDPHYVQARPSLLARARRADLLVCNGADLEVGWLPLLLQRAGNPRIQPGQPGHFLAAEQVTLLDPPQQLDRSQGDIHPQGNPHLHLDPMRLRAVAAALGERLAQVDAAHSAEYRKSTAAFLQRWDAATARWQEQAKALQDLSVVVVHTEWRYLFEWTGVRAVAHLENRPGIPPSSSHLASVLRKIAEEKPRAILTAPGRSQRGPDWIRERTEIPVLLLPYTVGGSAEATGLFTLFEDTLRRLESLPAMSEGLQVSILGPAFLAGLLVLSTHVPLGREVIRRGIIFIDIAIAQLAGTGVIAAKVLGLAEQWWQLQLSGLAVALAGAAFLTWSERRWAALQEAIIGVIFVSMASLAILLLAGHPHAGEELQSLLAGQILWVTADMLWSSAAVFAAVLLVWAFLPANWRHGLFYVLFTVAVTTSVQLVGVYLVFASLILPALATHGLPGRSGMATGLLTGALGYGAGLLASARFDLPAGSLSVLGLLAACLLVLAARGLLQAAGKQNAPAD